MEEKKLLGLEVIIWVQSARDISYQGKVIEVTNDYVVIKSSSHKNTKYIRKDKIIDIEIKCEDEANERINVQKKDQHKG